MRVEAIQPRERVNGTVLFVEDDEADRFLVGWAFGGERLKDALKTVSDGRMAVSYLSGTGKFAACDSSPT